MFRSFEPRKTGLVLVRTHHTSSTYTHNTKPKRVMVVCGAGLGGWEQGNRFKINGDIILIVYLDGSLESGFENTGPN